MKFAVLLAELKRRKVFRVTAVYGATSFAILQLADILVPSLRLPPWTITLILALIIIGFPMALALAWTFESAQEGWRRTEPAPRAEIDAILAQPRTHRWRAGIAALAGVLLLIAGTAWTVTHRGAAPSASYDSIAVLPFANMSGDAANDYFGDGLAEELLNALSGIQGLKVAARTSAFAFKGANVDIRTIADTLGVATVLEGSVRRSAGHIRITAQLIDAKSGYHLWSQTYDRPLTDLFTVQDAITREIVAALAGKLTVGKEDLYRGGTRDVAAYDLYLLGRQKWATRQVPRLRESIQHFEHAIARDSNFALAWSGKADGIDALAWRVPAESTRIAEAKYAAQRALVLDPELAEGWASLGVLALDFDRDFRVAELAFRRAIALKPSNASPYHWLGDALRYTGRIEESWQSSTRALDMDPVSGVGMNGMLQTLLILGRDAEARQIADRLRAVGYTDLGSLINMTSAGRRLGYNADELSGFMLLWAQGRGYSKPEEAAVIGRAVIDARWRPQAQQVIRKMAEERLLGTHLAELSVAIGDLEGAIANLERAVRERDNNLVIIGTDWAFDPLRKDPRFISIVRQMGLPNDRAVNQSAPALTIP